MSLQTNFQPFTPWTPPHRRVPNPQDPSPATPQLTTPLDRWLDTANLRDRQSNFTAAMNMSAGSGTGGALPIGIGGRRPLVEVMGTGNTLPPSFSTTYTSPIISSDPNGVWGPPLPQPPQQAMSVEEKLAQAEQKIRELSVENTRLRERVYAYPSPPISATRYTPPTLSSHSSIFFDAYNQPNYGGSRALGTHFEDEVVMYNRMRYSSGEDGSDNSTGRIAPEHIAKAVLSGHFNYIDMHSDYIAPVIWIIANHQPRDHMENGGLKTAVNALATRLGGLHDENFLEILTKTIIESAKRLCYTSYGNYLCQQLVERGSVENKVKFITEIKDDIVDIASNKFGTHVLCKAVMVKELEEPILEALLTAGIFESLKTGARRLWREYLEKCRQAREFGIFDRINTDMKGRWTELACQNENGSIAVQQVFEVFGSQELMEPCCQEILAEVSRVANNQFGHFVITKLISDPLLHRVTADAVLLAYPPVATTHHGVNFAKIALTEGGRPSMVRYVDAICSQQDGRTPGIIAIATSSIGKAHLTFVLSCLNQNENMRVRQVCRSFSTTLRTSQSGNDLLRSLNLMHASATRYRGTTG